MENQRGRCAFCKDRATNMSKKKQIALLVDDNKEFVTYKRLFKDLTLIILVLSDPTCVKLYQIEARLPKG